MTDTATDLEETLTRIATDHADDDITVVLDDSATGAYITDEREIVVNAAEYAAEYDGLTDTERKSLLYEAVAHLAMLSTQTPLDAKTRFVEAAMDKYDYEPVVTAIDGEDTGALPEGPHIDALAGVVFNVIEDARARYALTYRYRDRREAVLSHLARAMDERPPIDENDRERMLVEGVIHLAMTGTVQNLGAMDDDVQTTLAKIRPYLKRARTMENPDDRMTVAHTVLDIVVRALDGDTPSEDADLPDSSIGEWYDAADPETFVSSPLVDA